MIKVRPKNFIDLTSKKFSKLLVLGLSETIKSKQLYWNCICDCGNYKEVSGMHLRNGSSTSCGCNQKLSVQKEPGFASYNHVFNTYKRHSKERKLSFDLSFEEFKNILSKSCFYCNSSPKEWNVYDRVNRENNERNIIKIHGIDRKDNDLGYNIQNCVPCCTTCNFMKKDMPLDKFLDKVCLIYQNLSLK